MFVIMDKGLLQCKSMLLQNTHSLYFFQKAIMKKID